MDEKKKVVILFIVNSKFSKTANLAFPLYKEFLKENPTIKFKDFSLQLNSLVKDGILQKNAGPKGETYKLTWKAEQAGFMQLYLSDDVVESDLNKETKERINPTTKKINAYTKYKSTIRSWLEVISWIAGIIGTIFLLYQFFIS